MTSVAPAWRYYLKLHAPHGAVLLGIAVSAALQFALVVALVLQFRRVFDELLPGRDVRALTTAVALILLLHLTSSAIALWIRFATLRLTKLVIRDIRFRLLDRLFQLPRSYYNHADRNALHARLVQDSERVDMMGNALVGQMLPAGTAAAAFSLALVWLNWRLFLVLTLAAPCVLVATRVMGRRLRARMLAFREAFEQFSKGMLFVLQTIDLARIQTAEPVETERQRKTIEELRVTSGAMAWFESAYGLAQSALAMAMGLLVLLLGGYLVAGGAMSVGSVVAFYVTLSFLSSHVRALLAAIPSVLLGHAALTALYPLVKADDEPLWTGTRTMRLTGELAFEHVAFGYGGADVLSDLHIRIAPHSTVALVGANGCGKTTLLMLVAGFYRPTRGRLLADGVEYGELEIAGLRRQIGFVMQDAILFSGTIAENLSYGTPGVTAHDLRVAAELATADEFIRELPAGYHTQVGDGGVRLSGGQRQRLAIARALLRKPKILVLDEPTAHLDGGAIARLMTTLRALPDRPTILIASHDMEVVRHADVVCTIVNGRGRVVPARADLMGVAGG